VKSYELLEVRTTNTLKIKNINNSTGENKMKKMGFIILAVVLALGALGAGYAAWSQTLTINGSVSTGTYDVVFQNLGTSETDALAVGTVTADNLATDGHSFKVTIGNGYPGYVGVATFEVKNTGTVPAKISSITVNGVSATNYSAVVNGIAVGNVIAPDAADSGNNVTITIADGATETISNQEFTVTIVTDQGI
jgi:predicted ribosomally synthesized peptide with SipW-like signal peptide